MRMGMLKIATKWRVVRPAIVGVAAILLISSCAYYRSDGYGNGHRIYRGGVFYPDLWFHGSRYHDWRPYRQPRYNSDYRRPPPRRDRPSIRDRD